MSDPKSPQHDGLVDELRDPLAALPRYFGEAEYDPRSLRPVVGPVITTARRGALGLVRRWLMVTVQRQDRVNRLVTRMLELLDQRSAPQVDRRLLVLEEELRAKQSAAQVAELELTALAQSLGATDELAHVDLVPLLAELGARLGDPKAALVIGSASLAKALGARLVDADAAVVRAAGEQGIAATQLEPEFHIRSTPDGMLDAIAAYGIAERIDPGHLLVLLRQFKRALAPGGTLAIIALNAASPAALGERFWLDPRRTRPAPRALLAKMCEAAGFGSTEAIELHEAGEPAFVAVIARRA